MDNIKVEKFKSIAKNRGMKEEDFDFLSMNSERFSDDFDFDKFIKLIQSERFSRTYMLGHSGVTNSVFEFPQID